MKLVSLALALCAGAASVSASAQATGQCIVAGRLSDGMWAPKFASVALLGASGQPVNRPSKQSLAGVRRASLAQPALLSRCDGNGPLANGDNEPAGPGGQVPAVSAGMVEVEGVSFPKLRTGGELVELRVRVAPERVVLVAR
jgi:hypothetical protein